MRRFCAGVLLLALLFVATGNVAGDADTSRPVTWVEATGVVAFAADPLLRLSTLRQATRDGNPDRWSRAYALTVAFVALYLYR